MLSGEDFGYLKDDDRNKTGLIAKKALLIGAVLFSISCFVYITINAYYFAYHDQDSDVKVIKSPDFPIKIVAEEDGSQISGIDKSVYDNIIGNRNLARENLSTAKVIEQAGTPVAKSPTTKNVVDKMKDTERNNQNTPPTKINNSNIVVYDQNREQTQKPENVSAISFPSKNVDSKTVVPVKNEPKVKGLSRVQIAALSSKASAVEYWSKLKNQSPSLFSGYNYFIQEINLGAKGTFYRLQVGNFQNQVDAENFCTKFISQTRKSKADCIIVE